jgi:hypothetical protein
METANYGHDTFYDTGLNKDPSVWLDGARPPPISLIMSWTN